MSHSAVLDRGITADGTDLTTSDLRLLFRITSGLFGGLEYRGVDVIIPTAVGRVPMNRVADLRTIVAEGTVYGLGADEAAQRADAEASMLTLDALMRQDQGPYEIVVTLMDGSTATIEARPSSIEPVDGPVPSVIGCRLEWISVDPDWEFGTVGS